MMQKHQIRGSIDYKVVYKVERLITKALKKNKRKEDWGFVLPPPKNNSNCHIENQSLLKSDMTLFSYKVAFSQRCARDTPACWVSYLHVWIESLMNHNDGHCIPFRAVFETFLTWVLFLFEKQVKSCKYTKKAESQVAYYDRWSNMATFRRHLYEFLKTEFYWTADSLIIGSLCTILFFTPSLYPLQHWNY